MKVNLIQNTQNPLEILYTSARTCYSDKSSFDIINHLKYEDNLEKQQKLIHKVLDSDHKSICRHVYFTFCLDGISRACANQLERHTAGFAYSQQSLRYVKFNFSELMDEGISVERVKEIVYKYYVVPEKLDNNEAYINALITSLFQYNNLIKTGVEPEDARGILGLNFKTNVVCSCNLESFIHLCNLRLCTRSQIEIRDMVQLMKEEILKHDKYKFLAKYLVPKCKTCTEKMKCEKK